MNNHDPMDIYVETSENDLQCSSYSWASKIENELKDSEDIPLTGSCSSSISKINNSDSETEYDKLSDIHDILQIDTSTEDDLTLLNYQTILTNHLRKIIKIYVEKALQNKDVKDFDFSSYLDKLSWIINVSSLFIKKLNLPKIEHTYYRSRTIPRSSYKFCNYGHDCEYNYNHTKYKGCFAQHYVHNYVCADTNALYHYIVNMKKDGVDNQKLMEIDKCMNTISYVISHMRDELKYIEYYHKGKSNDFHQERTPDGKRKKYKIKSDKC